MTYVLKFVVTISIGKDRDSKSILQDEKKRRILIGCRGSIFGAP